jgi:hypothetical protein
MTNEQGFGLPHIERVGDEDIEFPRLDVDDLLRWANEVKQKRRVDEEARVRADAGLRNNPELQQKLIAAVAQRDVEFAELWQRTFTPGGARKAVIESLKKGGKTDGQAVAIVKRIHWAKLSALAQEILSPPAPVEGQEKAGPLPESGTTGTAPPNAPPSESGAESPTPDV